MNKYLLCGNPNVGKTTFINSLCNTNEHVGNWHGVTVDFKEIPFKTDKNSGVLVDLPGIYSLSTYTFEEEVSRNQIYLTSDKIINLIDANNLERNLYFTLQLLEMKKELVLCLNMANELKKNGKEIDINILEKELKTKIFLFDAQKKDDVKAIINNEKYYNNFEPIYLNNFPIKQAKEQIKNYLSNSPLNADFLALKCLEQDEYVFEILKLPNNIKDYFVTLNLKEKIIESRFNYIQNLVKKCQKSNEKAKVYGTSKLDKIFLNKFLALPIFILILCSIFYLTFSSLGVFIADLINSALNFILINPILKLLNNITTSAWIISFFENGIFSVISTLASFLPQIVLLFLFLTILEDTGYLSRLAFLFEDIFSRVGLNGKTVFTLLMGFGCSTTAALTTRTLDDKNAKIKATMLCSYMSCSAKIPLYSVICASFFTKSLPIIIFLYFLGVLVALFVSVILEKTILKSKENSFILEFPAYRMPKAKRILKTILFNITDFIKRVGSVLLTFSIIIWVLQSCTIKLKFITNPNIETSILESIGKFLAPVFAPLGFGNYGAVACLICGIVAKEVIVTTMTIINKVGVGETLSSSLLNSSSPIHFTPISAFSYLIFSLLYAPCIATIGVYFKELGRKWAWLSILIQFVVAYIVTFIFYQIMCLFNGFNFLSIFLALIIISAIIFAFIMLLKIIKKPKVYCFNCSHCNKNCSNRKQKSIN